MNSIKASAEKTGNRKTALMLGAFLMLIASIILFLLARHFSNENRTTQLQNESLNTLRIQSLNAQTYTNKYAVAASMLSKRPDITNFVKYALTTNTNQTTKIQQLLYKTNALLGSHSILLADRNGNIVSRTDLLNNINSFPPDNFRNTTYFQTASQRRMGRANIIIDENNRFYLFAAPIIDNKQFVGSTILLISFDHIEQSLALISDPVFAIDRQGTILLSNVEDWRLKKFITDTDQAIPNNIVLTTLDQSLVTIKAATNIGNTNEEASDENHRKKSINYLIKQEKIPILEWNLITLQNQSKIDDTVNTYSLITLLGLLLAWQLAWIAWRRNQSTQLERQKQIEFANELEARVKRRTKDVSIANQKLEKEIDERKNTEQELRKTQQELIQAAKMASIGQMSTVLAHEYNQPISAIQFYAINAETMLNNKQNDDAIDNMQRISELTKRMATLTNSLRNFAHKPAQALKNVKVENVIDQVSTLMKPRLKSENVKLIIKPAKSETMVLAGNTRLTQIISNLIANSIDALKNQENKEITLEWMHTKDNKVQIYIKDNGPGIPSEHRDKIYEAFYSTKSNQEGLGLGLFIVYNLINELKGNITITEEANYDTVFCIELDRQ